MSVCVCVKASESTGSILSEDLSLDDTSHALFDHITQLLQQRRDAIAVRLLRLCCFSAWADPGIIFITGGAGWRRR